MPSGNLPLRGKSSELVDTEKSPSTGTSQSWDKSREQIHENDRYRAIRAEKKISRLEVELSQTRNELAQTRNELSQARDEIDDLEAASDVTVGQLRSRRVTTSGGGVEAAFIGSAREIAPVVPARGGAQPAPVPLIRVGAQATPGRGTQAAQTAITAPAQEGTQAARGGAPPAPARGGTQVARGGAPPAPARGHTQATQGGMRAGPAHGGAPPAQAAPKQGQGNKRGWSRGRYFRGNTAYIGSRYNKKPDVIRHRQPASQAHSNIAAATEGQAKRPAVDEQGFTLAGKSKSAPANRGVAQQSIIEQAASGNRFALLKEQPPPASVWGSRKSTDSQQTNVNLVSTSHNSDDKSTSTVKAAIRADTPATPAAPARNSQSPNSARRAAAWEFFINPPASYRRPKVSAATTEATPQRMPMIHQGPPKIEALESKMRSVDAAAGKVVKPKKEPTPMDLEDVTKMSGGKSHGRRADSDESGENEQGKGQGSGALSNKNRDAVPSSSTSQVLPARVIDAEAIQPNSTAPANPPVGGTLVAIPASPRSVAPTPGTTILGKRNFDDEDMYTPQSNHGNKAKKKRNGKFFTVRS